MDGRLRRNQDFQTVYAKGRYWATQHFVLHALPNGLPQNRVGFSISKKQGKAVVRNLIKRRLREVYRSYQPQLQTGYDLVISARRGSAETDFSQIQSEMKDLLSRSRLWQKRREV